MVKNYLKIYSSILCDIFLSEGNLYLYGLYLGPSLSVFTMKM